ncbi:MAG: NAD(P)-dependent oxidoreductase [Sedimentisphaerales bacterium]
MKKILIDLWTTPESLKKLKSNSEFEVQCTDFAKEAKRPLPVELIRDANILFCAFPPDNFAEMKKIELIQVCSAGYTQLYGLDLVKKKVRACNGRGVFDTPIAEWNIAMMINLARDLRGMIRNQENGLFVASAQFQNEIGGKTVGIWGYGGIGRQTARLCKMLNMTVRVMDVVPIGRQKNVYIVPGTGDPEGKLPDKAFTPDQKQEFLSGLDFLILTMPLTKRNEGIVGEQELKALPKHAFLLNPARGPLVQEQALLKALREGTIAGAALDTHWYYPLPADHPIRRFPNVIITPHISGSGESPNFLKRAYDIFIQNCERFIRNEPLLNELSESQLDGQ